MIQVSKKCSQCESITLRLYLKKWCKNCYEKDYNERNAEIISKKKKLYREANKAKLAHNKTIWAEDNLRKGDSV